MPSNTACGSVRISQDILLFTVFVVQANNGLRCGAYTA